MLRRLFGRWAVVGLSISLLACGGGGGGGAEGGDDGGGGGGDEPFSFETTEEIPVSLQVASRGTPIPLAKVTITNALPQPGEGQTIEDLITGNVYFQGMTDAEGRIDTTIQVPEKFGQLDVIVIKRGMTGPYSVEGFRELWGPFGPAARVTLSRHQMGDVSVDLEDEQ